MTKPNGGAAFWAIHQGHNSIKYQTIGKLPFCRNMAEFIYEYSIKR